MLVAEFCEPKKRHIVSVFKIIQELLAPSGKKGKNQFQQLMELLPNDHKAKWFAGAALNTAEQSMASVMSTALSRLNAFLDSELEQILCFDTEIDAEKFCKEKSALFIIMPEENPATFFMISPSSNSSTVRSWQWPTKTAGAYGGQRQVMADPEAQGGGRAPGRERARDGGVSVQTSPRNRRMPEPPVTGKTAEVKSDGQA